MSAEAGQTDTARALVTEIRAKRLQHFLKGRREHLSVSQEVVAERLEISARAYGNWERGKVKEWTDQKLYALAQALEMSEFQTVRLFWIAVDRAPQPDLRAMSRHSLCDDPATEAFLDDYRGMMDALSLPTFLIDHRWDIKMANKAFHALFRDVRAHPTAMPSGNFLRFGLFHPDAPTVLSNHQSWQLAMLAELASSLERHDQDSELQNIRRDVYLRRELRDAYLKEMPDWVLGSGADLVHHDYAVRELRHPDPLVGLQGCRIVEETPRPLQAVGLSRITLVFVDRKLGTREPARSESAFAA
ncbi:helix-turn-helix domain-containing protein [Streptomyces lydicus]|uniref:helix-turn-helix domain-containing protein n=1 Tax=Streptomyces lydicus TaxID=47763 RepID=UPI003411AE47